jgi:hypothetical protein
LTAAEAYRSRIINSHLTKAESRELEERALGAPWECVPGDADLAEADPLSSAGLFSEMANLYWHFTWPKRVDGVRVAKVHKVLHPKRPRLYPIFDQYLRSLYERPATDWLGRLSHLHGITVNDSPQYWAAFRDDLVGSRDAVEGFCVELAEAGDEAVRSMAQLTGLRLLDIVAWSVAAGSGK